MDATIESTSIADAHSADVSQSPVGFVAGSRPKFSDETAELLRRRLTAVALTLAIIFAAAFVGNVIRGVDTAVWLRVAILVIECVCLAVLRSNRECSMFQLRLLELIVFGSVVAQVSMMYLALTAQYAAANDATSVIGMKYYFWTAWCLVILIYGIFMPNTWKRGAAVMIPLACMPYLLLAWQNWWSPEIGSLFAEEESLSPIPLPFVAALVGVYGTNVINATRREAFKARQFGQYRLVEQLGSGGMGEVYKAEHVLLKRPCAMKLIKPGKDTDATAIARFEKEVKAMSKLTHWNTVEIYDYGHTEDGTFYYVMELLPGLSLEELVDHSGRLPAGRVVHLLRQVCGALQEAHDTGLIHRDIKPANIFSAQRGGVYDVAKLLDFGLVKEQSAAQDADAPSAGKFSGTPLYMAPEQVASYEQVDGRADIYALGAVAYFLLTGRPVFVGANVVQLLAAHAGQPVTPPTALNPSLPSDLEAVILRCLEKEAGDRYPDANSLRHALDDCSCSRDWTPESASEWWHDYRSAVSERSDEKKTQPESDKTRSATRDASRLDVTIDLKLGETEAS